jgi:hypothetical protein
MPDELVIEEELAIDSKRIDNLHKPDTHRLANETEDCLIRMIDNGRTFEQCLTGGETELFNELMFVLRLWYLGPWEATKFFDKALLSPKQNNLSLVRLKDLMVRDRVDLIVNEMFEKGGKVFRKKDEKYAIMRTTDGKEGRIVPRKKKSAEEKARDRRLGLLDRGAMLTVAEEVGFDVKKGMSKPKIVAGMITKIDEIPEGQTTPDVDNWYNIAAMLRDGEVETVEAAQSKLAGELVEPEPAPPPPPPEPESVKPSAKILVHDMIAKGKFTKNQIIDAAVEAGFSPHTITSYINWWQETKTDQWNPFKDEKKVVVMEDGVVTFEMK